MAPQPITRTERRTLLLGLVLGLCLGAPIWIPLTTLVEQYYFRKEAVRHHAGEWITNEDGSYTFRWKDQLPSYGWSK